MTIYLDHAATAPMLPAARDAMIAHMHHTGNPSSLHGAGRAARSVVEESRERVAEALGARPSEVIFTSGGTEADNLAIKGGMAAAKQIDPRRTRVVTSGIEHHAVIDSVEHLADAEGAEVTFLEPDHEGRVLPADLTAAIEQYPDSIGLVSVMWANNEVGVVQDIPALTALAHAADIPLHSDAVQAAGHLPIDFEASGVDLLSVTAHKLGGPVGVGALLARRDARLAPLTHGGGQERSVRSGTLDVPGIAGFAVALEHAVTHREEESARVVALRDRFLTGVQALDPSVRVTGAWTPGSSQDRLPGNAHITIPGCQGDSLLYLLDAAGIACSTGSACQAGVPRPSHVVLALGRSEEEAVGSLRISFGRTSTDSDVDAVLAALPDAIARSRRASGAA